MILSDSLFFDFIHSRVSVSKRVSLRILYLLNSLSFFLCFFFVLLVFIKLLLKYPRGSTSYLIYCISAAHKIHCM